MEITSESEKQTQKVASNLAKKLEGRQVIALYGELGAGKSVFTRALARSLGIKGKITSPTFVLLKTYKAGKKTLNHLDLYRVKSINDLAAIDLGEIFSQDSIVAIEWAERIAKHLPKNRWDIKIENLGANKRKISITRPPTIRHSGGRRPIEPKLNPDIKKAAQILRSGGVIVFPTDTVWGIGCIYNNKEAVDRTYSIKGTERTQAFPNLVSNIDQVKKIAQITPQAKRLIGKFWPGGLTVILDKKGTKTKMGFRMPDSALVRDLIDAVGKPIIGTSANFHGRPTPRTKDQLDPKFIKLVDYVIEGECQLGVESTVVDATTSPVKVLRQGAVKI